MQWAHLRALSGIVDRHSGHSLVTGSDGAGGGAALRITAPSTFTMTMKTASATRRKVRRSFITTPIWIRPMCHCSYLKFGVT